MSDDTSTHHAHTEQLGGTTDYWSRRYLAAARERDQLAEEVTALRSQLDASPDAAALRDQIARDIELQRAPITVHIDYPDVAWDAARKSSARIARGES